MSPRKRTLLIVGAGDAGLKVSKEIRRHPELGYAPVGFIDDDANKSGKCIDGLPVLGTRDSIVETVTTRAVDVVLLAIPSLQPPAAHTLMALCRQTGAIVKAYPGMRAFLQRGEDALIRQLRETDGSDLLEREPAPIDHAMILPMIRDGVILVTGAAGTIGSQLCREIIRYNPKKLLLLDQAETPLYLIYRELVDSGHAEIIEPILCDIAWTSALESVIKRYRPTHVYHTAALKHVPACEWQPAAAIRTNVVATWDLMQLAIHYDVQRFTQISTDKAAMSSSLMGATKRLVELCIDQLAREQSDTIFSICRFGNVICSAGSVVPIFERALSQGVPLPVTHPETTRYFMTVHEAVSLVIEASVTQQSGDLCILDMGDPIKILDLAKRVIERSGRRPYVVTNGNYPTNPLEIPIVFTGLRDGEKLHEVLWNPEEEPRPSHHPRIFQALRDPSAPPIPCMETVVHELRGLISCITPNTTQAIRNMVASVLQAVSSHPIEFKP